jgi:hypothetical protein
MDDPFDPLQVMRGMWPQEYFYDKQAEFVYGVRDATELYVVAGNELGKDWILGRTCLAHVVYPWCFYPRHHFLNAENRDNVKLLAGMRGCKPSELPEWILHQRRVVTTSVKDKHLDVLWGEVGNAWRTCSEDLSKRFVMTHHEIRFKEEAEEKNPSSYMIGVVSGSTNFEGLTGHHAHYALAAGDEASGLPDGVYEALNTWAKRQVYITNPKPCNNFVKRNFRQGDLVA